jgi:hypothetical protein
MASNRTFLTFLNTTLHNWFKDKEIIKEISQLVYGITIGNGTSTGYIPNSQKGVLSGVATLGTDGYVPLTQTNPMAIEKIYAYSGALTLPEQLGLTTNDVQNGDLVKLYSTTTSTTIMYAVVDYTKLNLSAGFAVFSAGTSVNFTGSLSGDITGTQTSTNISTSTVKTRLGQSTTSTDGWLSSTDWNVFKNKFSLPSLTSGSVLFSNGTDISQNNSNFYWDDTNYRLALGVNNLTQLGTAVKFVVGDSSSTSPRGLMSWQNSDDTNGARFHLRKSGQSISIGSTFAFPKAILSNGLVSVTVSSGGTGYSVGNVLTLGIGTGGTVVVTAVTAGVVQNVNITNMGYGYSASTTYNTSGGGGTGCTITVNEVGSTLGRIVSSGYDGSAFTEAANILLASSGTISTGIIPTTMSFYTTDSSGYYNETLKLGSNRTLMFPYNNGSVPSGMNGYITMWAGNNGNLNHRIGGSGNLRVFSFGSGGDTTYTFPGGSDMTLAGTNIAQTFTAVQTYQNGSSTQVLKINATTDGSDIVTFGSSNSKPSISVIGTNAAAISSGQFFRFSTGSNATSVEGTIAHYFDGTGSNYSHTTSTAGAYESFIKTSHLFSPSSTSAALYRHAAFTYTINASGSSNTGTVTGIFLNATETVLNGMTHNLMDLQVAGSSKFKVGNDGSISLSSGGIFRTSNGTSRQILYTSGSNEILDVHDNSGTTTARMRSSGLSYFTGGNVAIGTTTDDGINKLQVTGVSAFTGDVKLTTAGNGVYIKEGTNATMGVATLSAGTVVISTTKVTASSRIQLTIQSLGTVSVPKAIGVTSRSAGTSFTITSADNTDTSSIAWMICEPA